MIRTVIIIAALTLNSCVHMRFALNDGECTEESPIKADVNSYRYHLPDSPYYYRTKADLCFATEESAIKNGYFSRKAR